MPLELKRWPGIPVFPAEFLRRTHCHGARAPQRRSATSTAGYNQTFQQIARFSTPGLPLGKAAISYLRTVIVTAAVYWGFSSSLSALSLTFQHRAGVSPYTSPFGFAETCVFGKQSVEPLSFDPRLLRK